MSGRSGRALAAAIPLVLMAFAASRPLAAPQQPAPRTLAFVVGIEHYDNNELDKLQYAADDAKRVFEQLKVVTDLDPRSVLLLADDEQKDPAGNRVDAERLRNELQAFVQVITDRTHVVVYLGGHGTLSPAKALWYLPTDYDRGRKVKYVPFSEIQSMFIDSINGQTLHDVTLTFLVNMCGAGNAVSSDRVAMSVDDNRELIDVTRRIFREEKFGVQQYALIPATPKERNTFEDAKLQASVFARHLVDGLAGRASASGVVTTGSLFKYVSEKLGEELPRGAAFDGDIPLGVTRKIEAESEYLIGSALLASAQTLEAAKSGREGADHRLALLDLAQEQLANVAKHSTDLAGRALLRRAQTEVLASRPPPVAALPVGATLDALEAEQWKLLASAPSVAAPSSLRTLRDQLQAGQPFYSVVIDSQGLRPSARQTDPSSDVWVEVLKGFPGQKASARFNVPDLIDATSSRSSLLPENLAATISGWAATETAARSTSRLIVVYAGVAGLESMDRQTRPTPEDAPAQRLLPFGREEIGQITAIWKGPVTICFLAPFGGELLKAPPPPGAVSLLVAAQERRGMTFSGTPVQPSNVSLLARALQEGVERFEDFAPLATYLRERTAAFGDRDFGERYVTGTPKYVPIWGAPDWRPDIDTQLAPLRRFALHVTRGCAAERLETCDTIRSGDPFETLAAAAQKDLLDQGDAALPMYADAAKALRAEAAATSSGLGAAPTRVALARLADRVEAHVKERAARQGRKVVVLPIGVQDYASPLVADLPQTSADLQAYGEAFTAALSAANIPVTVQSAKLATTADDIKSAIKVARDALRADDMLVLVYSGRGTEINGRRYISAAGTAPCIKVTRECEANGQWTELVDLWEIAELMSGHWFLAIYDAQFTRPAPGVRLDAVLDKHLDSARRPVSDQLPNITRPARAVQTRGTGALELRPAGNLPPHQLHLWMEGTLTATADPPMRCGGLAAAKLTSPLGAAIVSQLPPKSRTAYREWLQAVAGHPCLTDFADDSPTLVAQGNADVSLFATAAGAELVDYLRNDDARSEMNLIAAASLTDAVLGIAPTTPNRVARAAVLLAASARLAAPAARASTALSPTARIAADGWNATAGALLAESTAGAAAADPATSPLPALWTELAARRYVLSGDAVLARAQLSNASPAVLAQRNLAKRFVELTEESARRQPVTLLEETSDVLQSAERSLGSTPSDAIAAARRTLTELVAREQSRAATRFTITPPAARDR